MKFYIPAGQYYLLSEAAQKWGVDVSYLRRLCGQGRLEGIRIGRAVWILPAHEVDGRSRPLDDLGTRNAVGSVSETAQGEAQSAVEVSLDRKRGARRGRRLTRNQRRRLRRRRAKERARVGGESE